MQYDTIPAPLAAAPHCRPNADQLGSACGLIQRSIRRQEIVVEPYDADLVEAFSFLADDSARSDTALEFWGTEHDGSEWRVHFRLDADTNAGLEYWGVALITGPEQGYLLEKIPGVHMPGSRAAAETRTREMERISRTYGAAARIVLLETPGAMVGDTLHIDEELTAAAVEPPPAN